MFTLFGKKKITVERVVDYTIDYLISIVDEHLEDIRSLLMVSPEFVTPPDMDSFKPDKLYLTAFAANAKILERDFPAPYDKKVMPAFCASLSELYQTSPENVAKALKKEQEFIARINLPSQNIIYGMSKAFFHHYELYRYQEEYFRNLRVPNPILLKRLDELFAFFVVDTGEILRNYQLK